MCCKFIYPEHLPRPTVTLCATVCGTKMITVFALIGRPLALAPTSKVIFKIIQLNYPTLRFLTSSDNFKQMCLSKRAFIKFNTFLMD